MNDPSADFVFPPRGVGFNSHDCVDLILDGPGDTTVRPMRPELRARALALRERLQRWQKEMGQPPVPPTSGG